MDTGALEAAGGTGSLRASTGAYPPASLVRRCLAVFIDFVFYFAVFAAVGVSGNVALGPYALPAMVAFDCLATGFTGASAGRLITGIRVLRPDGRPPGLVHGAIRTAVVFITGLVGAYVFSLQVSRDDAASYRMWWDTVIGTSVVRTRPARAAPPASRRTAALRGFGLGEDDLAINSLGRQSPRQRWRTMGRATLYALGVAAAVAVVLGALASMVSTGASFGGVIALLVGAISALGGFLYAREIWTDAMSGRVIAVEGVPTKGVEVDPTMDGVGAWRIPYLELGGVHKLGRRAFDSIEPGRSYRLYVLPASGRCVGAEPLD